MAEPTKPAPSPQAAQPPKQEHQVGTALALKQPFKHARIGVQQTKVRKVRSA